MLSPSDNPKVSIITVCYNSENTIESTIKSVISQNFPNFEYIIIDGASTDSTVDIIRKYKEKIDCIISEKDSGIYEAMNKGLANCNGDYVLFLNSGDRFYNNSVIADVINKSSGQDIIYGDLLLDYKNGTQKRRTQPEKFNRFLFIYRSIQQPATFVKRDMFIKYGKFDEKYRISADFDFFLRVAFKPGISFLYVPIAITVFDMCGISNDPQTFILRNRDRLKIQKEHLPFFYYLIAKIRFSLMIRHHQYITRQFLHILDRMLRFAGNK